MSDNPGGMATGGRDGDRLEAVLAECAEYESVAMMARIVEHARAVCADRGWDLDDTPWVVGYLPIGREPLPADTLEWARGVVRGYEASALKAAGAQTKPGRAESLDQNESPGGSP